MTNITKPEYSARNEARLNTVVGCIIFTWCFMLWVVLYRVIDAVTIKLRLSNFDSLILICTMGFIMGYFLFSKLGIFICENRKTWKEENENIKQG